MLPGSGNDTASPPLSRDPDDPLSSFPSESDAAVVDRPRDFNRLSHETGYEPSAFATRHGSEASKTESVALNPLRELAAQLAGEYSRIQDAARDAEARYATAVETVQDIEKRLGPLTALQDLGRHIDERFESLRALADEVTVKAQTLNDQKEMIEHAMVKAGRVADLLSAMDTRMATLKDGDHLLEQAEARLGRLEAVAAETTAQLERREQLKEELEHIDDRFEALHALDDEVTVKGETLNGQREMIERAVVEAGRVAELMGAMETRIAALKDGNLLIELTETRLRRLEEVAAETTAQFQRRDRLRDELGLELARLEMEVQVLTESGRRLQDLGRHTDERFEALNALADELTVRAQTLNGQNEMIARAVVEAARVAGLVDAMETRMAKLAVTDHLREQTEARLVRLEAAAADTTARLQRSERRREELGRELVRLETDVQILTGSAQRQAGSPVYHEEEFDAVDSRSFALPPLPPDRPAPVDRVDPRVEPPLPRVDWDEASVLDANGAAAGSPHLPSTAVMTRIRIPKTGRGIKYASAGAGLAVLVLLSVIVARSSGKTAPPELQLLPARILPSHTISVPALSGANLLPDEPETPAIATRPPTIAAKPTSAARPPAIATRPPAIAARPTAIATRPPSVDAPATRAAAAPSTEYFGTLAIASTPSGAAVFVDRQQVGQTPLELPHVRAGSHAVRIEREGYQRWTAAVNVPASQITRVTVKLDADVVR